MVFADDMLDPLSPEYLSIGSLGFVDAIGSDDNHTAGCPLIATEVLESIVLFNAQHNSFPGQHLEAI